MFSAYKIGITVALTSQVSSVLRLMARDFVKTDAEAKRLKATLNEIKLLGASGILLGGLGFGGLDLVSKLVKPANEYQHQLALMNAAGMQQIEIAKSIGAAWQATSTVMTTTATDNLATIRELRMVFRGDTGEAIANMPTVQKLQAVLQSVKGGNATDEAYTVAKALELKGAVQDPTQFTTQADAMTKAIIASGGKVTAADFLSAFKFGRTATSGWSDEFAYQILPTLIQEMKGGGGFGSSGVQGPGNALMSAFNAIVGGTISQKSLGLWQKLGLIDPSKEVFTKTGSLKGVQPGGIKGAADFQSNPFAWTQQYLVPALQKAGYNTPDQVREALQYLFPNRTAGFIMTQMAMQPWKFTGDQNIIKQAQGLSSYDALYRSDPKMLQAAMATQWDNLKTAFGLSVIPIILPAMSKLTTGLNDFARWAQSNPSTVDALVWGFTALSGSLLFSGSVLTLTAAFKGLRLLMSMGGLVNFTSLLPAGLMAVTTAAIPLVTTLGSVAAGFIAIGGAAAGLVALFQWFTPKGIGADPTTGKMTHGPLFGQSVGQPGAGIGTPDGHWEKVGNRSVWRAGGASAAPSSVGPAANSGAGILTDLLQRIEHLLSGGLTVQMDGQIVGQIVGDQMVKGLSGPRTDVNRFDGTVAYTPAQ